MVVGDGFGLGGVEGEGCVVDEVLKVGMDVVGVGVFGFLCCYGCSFFGG